jgi:hypothetical protein
MKDIDREIEEEAASGEQRWMTDFEMQQQAMEQGADQEAEAGSQEPTRPKQASAGPNPQDERLTKIANAQSTYDNLMKKPKRSLADQAKLKSAAQILAKNPKG